MATAARDHIVTDLASLAERALDAHDIAITVHRAAVNRVTVESEHLAAAESRRAALKLEAITRICEQDHPASPGKKFSPSVADDFAQIDPAYNAYKQIIAGLERSLTSAHEAVEEAAMMVDNARLRCELAIARVRVEGGLR